MYKITYVVIAVILAFHASNGQYLRDPMTDAINNGNPTFSQLDNMNNIMPTYGAIPVPPPGAAAPSYGIYGSKLPVVPGPGNVGYAVNNHPGAGDAEEKSATGANEKATGSSGAAPAVTNVTEPKEEKVPDEKVEAAKVDVIAPEEAPPAAASGPKSSSGASGPQQAKPSSSGPSTTTKETKPEAKTDASGPAKSASTGTENGKDDEDVDKIESNPLTSENAAIQEAHVASDNHTSHKVNEEKTERDELAENQAHHDDMINQLKSIHAQMLVAMYDPTNAHDVETALNATLSGMTGIEELNDGDKVEEAKLTHLHVNVNVMKHKSEQEHKREQMALIIKKEKLYAMATEWKARCTKWTARLDKARMVLATAFKGAMKSSKLAQKGCLANQNDHITKAQLKWSSLAINEVKCTFKYLLTVKVNKLKICDASKKASLSAKSVQRFPMPAFDGIKGLHGDKVLALLGLNNKRASEKTAIARRDAQALRADYEAKGMGEEKKVKKEIDTDDGTPKDGKETLEMVFERIMGRDMNLTWTKPQHYSNNRTLPNPLEMAKEECLGGNCNITAVDEKNDKHVKVLVNRKRVAAQPMPSAGADMPVKRL